MQGSGGKQAPTTSFSVAGIVNNYQAFLSSPPTSIAFVELGLNGASRMTLFCENIRLSKPFHPRPAPTCHFRSITPFSSQTFTHVFHSNWLYALLLVNYGLTNVISLVSFVQSMLPSNICVKIWITIYDSCSRHLFFSLCTRIISHCFFLLPFFFLSFFRVPRFGFTASIGPDQSISIFSSAKPQHLFTLCIRLNLGTSDFFCCSLRPDVSILSILFDFIQRFQSIYTLYACHQSNVRKFDSVLCVCICHLWMGAVVASGFVV